MLPLLLLSVLASQAAAGPADAVVRIPSHGGSGTIVETGEGWTLILTAAHLFDRGNRGKPITINAPHPSPGQAKKVGVKVVALGSAPADMDLALLQVNVGPAPYVTPVAALSVQPGECWSVGYDDMRIPPQVRPAKVMGQRGNDFLTDSRPWHGRSGGGLIDKRTGYLVGVVSAYTGPSNHVEYYPGTNGVYVSLPAIHRFLSQAGAIRGPSSAGSPAAPPPGQPLSGPGCPGRL